MSEVQEGTELVPRLWLADGEPLNFFDRGFVPSASTTTLAGWLPDAQLFEQIDHLRCLVLLGEPNLGKTTALRQTYEAARDAGDPTLWVDLSSSTEESRLHDKIFGSSAWQGWIDGDWRLQVFLDTLDLALLRVETVTELIMDGLKGSPVDRLALRIACRSAERYREFEQSLRQAFGEEQFGVYQLLPFSFADVERIARDRLKDVGEFMASIVEKGIQAQAMVPGTLMMLLNVVSEEGVLPSSRVEIFREAAKLLCREPREQRRRGRAAPQLTAGQRLAITERIAGQTVLSAHAAVAMDTARATVDALDPNEFAGGHETDKLIGSPTSFAVTERAVSEVLRLGLFVGLDEGRLGFRHKTYAEFLCAAWLASGALGEAQIDDLLFTSVDSARRVVPQLREVAGWLSAMSSQFTERLLATDPVVLLSGDPMSRASNERPALVRAVLEGVAAFEMSRFDVVVRMAIPHLAYPGLSRQLRKTLANPEANTRARETAADIAGACKVKALEKDLLAVALDESEPISVREASIQALSRYASKPTRIRLMELATNPVPGDADDDIKGSALLATWPSVLPLDAMLASLTKPKRNLYFGVYHAFVTRLLGGIADEDLPELLRWCADLPVDHSATNVLSELREQALLRAADHLEDQTTLEAFVGVVIRVVPETGELLSHRERNEHPEFLGAKHVRQRVLRALIPATVDGDFDMSGIVASQPSMAPPEDASAVAAELARQVGTPTERCWAQLLEAMLVYGADDEIVIAARSESPVLAELTRYRYDPVEIDSADARVMRERWQRWEEMRARREQVRAPRYDVVTKVAQAQTRWAEGDVNGFWEAVTWIEQVAGMRGREFLISDVRELPGWSMLSENVHEWLLSAAPRYLKDAEVRPSRWFWQQRVNHPAWAAYRALRMLHEAGLPIGNLWGKWAPVIVGWPEDASASDFERIAMEELVRHAPDEAAHWLNRALQRDARNGGHPFSVRRFRGLMVPGVEAVIVRRAKDSRHRPTERIALITFLIEQGAASGWALARRLVSRRAVKAGGDRLEIAVGLALQLLTRADDGDWQLVWPLIKDDRAFGRAIIVGLAEAFEDELSGRLTEAQLADLYSWVVAEYPYASDPERNDEAHFIGKREQIADWRNRLLSVLSSRGSVAAVQAFERLIREHPNLIFLKAMRARALDIASQEAWQAPSAGAVLRMSQAHTKRWVVSDEDLRRVLVEVLESATDELQGINPTAQLLWESRPKRRPTGEPKFASWLQSFLEQRVGGHSMVVGRETAIRPSGSGTGRDESLDLRVDAVAVDANARESLVSVLIEVKGSWNRGLMTDMESQLVDRYMDSSHAQGIYLVGFYAAEDWDPDHNARQQARRYTLDDLRAKLTEQADDVSERRGVGVSAVVIDCSLRPPRRRGRATSR